MDKKLIAHITAETVVLGSLAVYLIGRISALELRVAELEKDGQAIARHTATNEKKQAEIINAMTEVMKLGPHHSQSQPVHRPHVQAAPPKPQSKGTPHADREAPNKKVVMFSDVDDSDNDESSSDEEPTPPPKMKSRAPRKTSSMKVPVEQSRGARKNMDDVRAAAASLAPSEDE